MQFPIRVEAQNDVDGRWHATSFATVEEARAYIEAGFERDMAWAIILDQSDVDPALLGMHPTPGELVDEYGWPVR